jgi:hypothetical protein
MRGDWDRLNIIELRAEWKFCSRHAGAGRHGTVLCDHRGTLPQPDAMAAP